MTTRTCLVVGLRGLWLPLSVVHCARVAPTAGGSPPERSPPLGDRSSAVAFWRGARRHHAPPAPSHPAWTHPASARACGRRLRSCAGNARPPPPPVAAESEGRRLALFRPVCPSQRPSRPGWRPTRWRETACTSDVAASRWLCGQRARGVSARLQASGSGGRRVGEAWGPRPSPLSPVRLSPRDSGRSPGASIGGRRRQRERDRAEEGERARPHPRDRPSTRPNTSNSPPLTSPQLTTHPPPPAPTQACAKTARSAATSPPATAASASTASTPAAAAMPVVNTTTAS